MSGHLSAQIEFPAWFGKNSRRNKLDRLAQELQMHMRLRYVIYIERERFIDVFLG